MEGKGIKNGVLEKKLNAGGGKENRKKRDRTQKGGSSKKSKEGAFPWGWSIRASKSPQAEKGKRWGGGGERPQGKKLSDLFSL